MTEKKSTDRKKGQKKPLAKGGRRAPAKPKSERLGPGQLDKLVLDYMRKHKADSPHTASAIGKGIKRSSGAVANCLERQRPNDRQLPDHGCDVGPARRVGGGWNLRSVCRRDRSDWRAVSGGGS